MSGDTEPTEPTDGQSAPPSDLAATAEGPQDSTGHAEDGAGATGSGADVAGPQTAPDAPTDADPNDPSAAEKVVGGTVFSGSLQLGPALWGLVVLAALFLISTGVFVGTLLDGPRSSKEDAPAPSSSPNQIDVGFLKDMQFHHAQAVEMSVLIRDRTDDEEIRKVALDIELTQQQQIGQMYGLLASWGESQNNPSPMTWMNTDTDSDESESSDTGDPHAGMSDMPDMSNDQGSTMPGMASAADLEQLASLQGRAAERVFLELMIAHHQGGIPMATAAAENADEAWVRTLAQSIVDAQSAEITALRTMLEDRGGPTE